MGFHLVGFSQIITLVILRVLEDVEKISIIEKKVTVSSPTFILLTITFINIHIYHKFIETVKLCVCTAWSTWVLSQGMGALMLCSCRCEAVSAHCIASYKLPAGFGGKRVRNENTSKGAHKLFLIHMQKLSPQFKQYLERCHPVSVGSVEKGEWVLYLNTLFQGS